MAQRGLDIELRKKFQGMELSYSYELATSLLIVSAQVTQVIQDFQL